MKNRIRLFMLPYNILRRNDKVGTRRLNTAIYEAASWASLLIKRAAWVARSMVELQV